MLRPYHGVQWLENRGSYPFRYHRLTSLHGAHRAIAGDLDGDGDRDIVAVAFLPGSSYEGLRRERGLDAVIVLEQVAPGRFVRHGLENVTCDHPTCDLGDFDADGKVDLVIGTFIQPPADPPPADRRGAEGIIVRRNLGRPGPIHGRTTGRHRDGAIEPSGLLDRVAVLH
jgi:hypothetical protein